MSERPAAAESPPLAPGPGFRLSPRTAATVLAWALGVALAALAAYLLWSSLQPTGAVVGDDTEYGLQPVLQIGGPGEGPRPRFLRPMGVAFGPEGRIYVTDAGNNRVAVFSRRGRFLFEFGEFGVAKPLPGGTASWEPGRLNYPTGIDVDEDGDVYVADFRNDQIQVFDSEGRFLRRFPDPHLPVGQGSAGQDGTGIAVTDVSVRGDLVYATDTYQVVIFTKAGEFVRQFGRPGPRPQDLDHPNGVAVAEDGTIYVADSNHNRLTAFSPEGTALWNVGSPIGFADVADEEGLGLPRGVAVLADGRVAVADAFNFEVVLVSPQGRIISRLGRRGDRPAELDFPNDVDAQGADLVIADRGNDRVQLVRVVKK